MTTGAHSQHGSFLSGHTSNTSAVNPSMGAGIKDNNENTSQDASAASNLNGNTDVDPSSRESGKTFTPDQQSAPYGSSTPNNPAQAGKPSFPDAGSQGPFFGPNTPLNGYQQPAGFAYMPFPFYGQFPGYYPSINHGQSPYPGSTNTTFMYNSQLPHGVSPYIPTPLFYCSSVGLFNSWVHNFIKYLNNSGLKDLVPDSHDRTVREPTPEESQGLIHLFFSLVPQSSYPEWVQECFQKQMHPYDVIRQAMAYDMERSNVTTIINTIRSLKYNGGYPAFQYISYLHNLLDQLHPMDLHNYDSILKQTILDTLTGTYESISKHFFKNDTPYTINDIFSSIKREYQYYNQVSKISDPHFSPTPPSSPNKQHSINPSNDKRENNLSIVSTSQTSVDSATVKPNTSSHQPHTNKVFHVKATSTNRLPIKRRVVSSPSFSIPNAVVHNKENEQYDKPIFDSFLTSFILGSNHLHSEDTLVETLPDDNINSTTLTSSISTDVFTKSNQLKVTTLEPQVLSINNQSSTTVTPSPTSLLNNSSYICSQSQKENFFVDNSTLGGMSSFQVGKKYSEDCQEIKGNENKKVRIGHGRNIMVTKQIDDYDNNGITQDSKDHELVNMFANKSSISSTDFYNMYINEKTKKNIQCDMNIHPHRFKKRNIIHVIS